MAANDGGLTGACDCALETIDDAAQALMGEDYICESDLVMYGENLKRVARDIRSAMLKAKDSRPDSSESR